MLGLVVMKHSSMCTPLRSVVLEVNVRKFLEMWLRGKRYQWTAQRIYLAVIELNAHRLKPEVAH